MRLFFALLLTLGLTANSFAKDNQAKPMTPCDSGTERYFISYNFSKNGNSGFGRTLTCIAPGAMDTAQGIINVETQLNRELKGNVVIFYFQKLKS